MEQSQFQQLHRFYNQPLFSDNNNQFLLFGNTYAFIKSQLMSTEKCDRYGSEK